MKALILLLILAATAAAQTPRERFRLDAGDAAYWAGSAIDVGTSVGKREAGLFRNSAGVFAPGPNLAAKGGLWGGIKLLEWKYPEHRRAFFWSKIAVGVAFGAVGLLHNRNIGRER